MSRERDWSQRLAGRLAQGGGNRQQASAAYTTAAPDSADPEHIAQELAASEQRLQLAIAAGGFATWDAVRTTEDEEEIFWSESYFTMLGYPPNPSGRASRSMWRDRVHPDDVAEVMAAWARAEAGDGTFHSVHRICLPNGSVLWTEAQGKVMLLPDGRRRSVGMVQDITARRQAEADLRALQESAVRAARVNAVGAMAAALAHELNQPLNAMTNYCAVAMRAIRQSNLGDDFSREWRDQMGTILEKIIEQSQRAASVVRRLRECVASVRPDMRLIEVRTIVENAVAEARGQMRSVFEPLDHSEPVSLASDVAQDVGEVYVDQEQLEHVLVNLIRNAVDAVRESRERRVSVSAIRSKDGKLVEIQVADTGPGLAQGIAEHIFDSFVSGKRDGMGMGLAICRTLVELHGGAIAAENIDGAGARFRVCIPGPGQDLRVSPKGDTSRSPP